MFKLKLQLRLKLRMGYRAIRSDGARGRGLGGMPRGIQPMMGKHPGLKAEASTLCRGAQSY
jgi:hypothetical protein